MYGVWVDGWMDGVWMCGLMGVDGWMSRCMDGWVDVWVWVDGWMDGGWMRLVPRSVDGWVGWVDEWIGGFSWVVGWSGGGWMDGWVKDEINVPIALSAFKDKGSILWSFWKKKDQKS